MASKRRRRRAAERPLPPLSEKTGMSSEALLAHRELEVIRAGFTGKRAKHGRKVALLREAQEIDAAKRAS